MFLFSFISLIFCIIACDISFDVLVMKTLNNYRDTSLNESRGQSDVIAKSFDEDNKSTSAMTEQDKDELVKRILAKALHKT